jgi:acyl-coenzyme A synthetase/AMP-(fatty) acid ligase
VFDAFVTFHAHQHPHRSAVIAPSGAMTFAELDQAVSKFARALGGMNLPAGSIVAARFRNPVTHWLIVLALARLGIASACANDGAASLLITDRPDPASVQPTFHASDAWVSDVAASRAELFPPARPQRDQVGRVMLSSGTTGLPKRVGLSWRAANTAVRSSVTMYGADKPGPWLIELGVDTAFGFAASLAAWAAGQPVLMRGEASLETALARFEPRVAALIPLQLQYTLEHLSSRFKACAGMRLFVPGGRLKPALAREARLRLTPDIRIVYGASECGAAAIGDASLLAEHQTLAGYAVPGAAIEIVDADGKGLPCGEEGEVRIQTDRMADGYLNAPAGSGTPFRDGWFHPGDRGRLLEDGLLLIEGRIDDVMNIGGVKLKASSMDDALADCPGVVESFAFAAPSPGGMDKCCIALVTTNGFDRDAVLTRLQAIDAVPASVRLFFVDRLPRTPTGKVERTGLMAMVASARER